MDRYLIDEALALGPLHPNKHAYQDVKSWETALHQLVYSTLDQQEAALGVFVDIGGTFINT